VKLLFGHDTAVADFVGRINGKLFHEPYTAIGVTKPDGQLIGGFVFTGYTGECVEMSLAGPATISREAWRVVAEYVFGQMGCSRLQVHTRKDHNRRVKRTATRLGFHMEGTARRYYGDHDALVYSLTADQLPKFRRRWRI
jgi:RimJ/RimL family protein N-acetyltransferase